MSHVGGYKFLFADLRSGAINLELPVFGTFFSRILNQAGSATFSFGLDSTDFPNNVVLEATEPGKTCLYIDRGGSLVWGGPIWSRTYQSQAKVLSYTAQTFESYLNRQFIEEDLNFTNADQRDILLSLIEHMQEKPFANINLITPTLGAWETPGIARTVELKRSQVWSYKRAVEYLIEYHLGFDWSIEVRYGPGRVPQRLVTVDNELGSGLATTQLVFDYPGNIKNYYFPENASRASTTTIGVGAGDDEGKLLSKATDEDLYELGYPDLQTTYDNQDVSIQSTLDSQTLHAQSLNRVPISVPTFELQPDQTPEIGSWNIGDHARFDIQDARFPEGKRLESRIIGWEVRPNASGELEEVRLIIPGEEEGV
jgi:hypothetical protein